MDVGNITILSGANWQFKWHFHHNNGLFGGHDSRVLANGKTLQFSLLKHHHMTHKNKQVGVQESMSTTYAFSTGTLRKGANKGNLFKSAICKF